ncbi:chromate transporter, partial [Frankia sp. Cpl3]|nr:chromate transporter [Frankia sp. Cpl3]
IIAIAGMSPGSIATNSALIVGFQKAGLIGAIVSAAGMVLPSLLLLLLLAKLLGRIQQERWVKAAFYGLRPIVTGLIIFASIQFALSNQLIGTLTA